MESKKKAEEDAILAFMNQENGSGDDDNNDDDYVPLKVKRKLMQERLLNKKLARNDTNNNNNNKEGETNTNSNNNTDTTRNNQSLLDQAAMIKKIQSEMDQKSLKQLNQMREEQALLKEANQVQTNALQSSEEIATGKRNTESIKTTWTCPKYLLDEPESFHDAVRKKWHIIVEGDDCPPPIKSFKEMKIPGILCNALARKGIARPTPIQVQAIPALLTGRDLIGIAFTGSGKTLTFGIPLLMFAMEEEMNMPLEQGEGPICLVLCPSRELARQTHEVIEYYSNILSEKGLPCIRTCLCIGGEDKRVQLAKLKDYGAHCIVATPGRLNDLLNQQKISLDICKYFVLDEADRMLDLGFDEEVHHIIDKMKRNRQTVLFSATMPQKFQDFAKNTLLRPILVNVGRAGAANLDVIQEVEYVKNEAKIVYLLECLQKTSPPVVIFCERKSDVDEIYEYLLVKGVEAVSIHGGKDQEERNEAIRLYKNGQKDVLVATDIAAKGLDFPDIQHVINFDMPKEIENYVHRIGRTGRGGKTGVATTFINKDVEVSALLDLKHLLIEAKQRVPPVLQALDDPDDDLNDLGGVKGCAFCGGLGHRITDCPKLDKNARKLTSDRKDLTVGGDW